MDVLTDMFYHKHRRLMVVSGRCCVSRGVLTDNNKLSPDFSGHGVWLWMGVLAWMRIEYRSCSWIQCVEMLYTAMLSRCRPGVRETDSPSVAVFPRRAMSPMCC